MRELIIGKLWTGNAHEARNVERILQSGIAAVLDLAIEEAPASLPRDLIYVRCPIDDGQAAPLEGIEFAIRSAAIWIGQETPCLIACSAGLSRSQVIAAAAIGLQRGLTLAEVLAENSQLGPVDVSPGFFDRVQTVFDRLNARPR